MKPRHRPSVLPLLLGAALALAASALAFGAELPRFEDNIAQRTLACAACHGRQGRAAPDGYYPRIAGKPAGYLYHQLQNFREGRRHYAPMQHMVDPLSDDYLREIADHFSALDLPYPPPAARAAAPAEAQMRRGEALARRGDTALDVPACISCHGERLTGSLPAVPGLLGLPPDYLNAQLGAWRSGERQAHAPDCMATFAKRLNAEDISAVAGWLSAQPLPADTRPARALPQPMPLECGSNVPAEPAPRAPRASDPAAAAAQLPTPPQPVARGAWLARAGNCMDCHTARGGAPFTGGRGLATPFGTVHSTNLTPDDETGLGRWSTDDFWRALHDGRSRDGRLLVPAFPYPQYTRITREDSDALFAWLRTLPAVRRDATPHDLRWPYGSQAALRVWRALYFRPGTFQPDPARSAQWNRGAYLVQGLGHCASCHASRDWLAGQRDPLALAGGPIPAQNWWAPSLSSPREAGVAASADDVRDFVQLMRTGIARDAVAIGPMADVVRHSTQFFDAAELEAMAAYLRTLPRDAPEPERAADRVAQPASPRGARLYTDHCAQCHGEKGEGVAGAYPALTGNRAVTMDDTTNLVRIVLQGGFAPATAGNPRPFGMPPYLFTLGDADVAAVLTHLRGAFGNRAAPVTELDVGRVRSGGLR